jgi:hypothetical protein
LPTNADCPITTDPTGAQTLQLPNGDAWDFDEPEENAGNDAPTLIIVQTLGEQTSPCVENPLPPQTVNNFGINGGQLP